MSRYESKSRKLLYGPQNYSVARQKLQSFIGFYSIRRRQMIAFSCVLRVDRVLRYLSPYVKARPFNDLQRQCYRCSSGMDRKMKRKVDLRVWRPVSTQACSIEEDITVVAEDGSRKVEVRCSNSSSVQSGEEGLMATEAVDESVIGSSVMEDDVKVEALKPEIMVSDGKHLVSLNVGASLFRFIQGKGGLTQKNIEEQMGVKIIFPSSKKEEESITIEGSSVESVTRASEKIQSIIDEAVKSPSLQYSHFISLPLAIHPELVDKLMSFQITILGNGDQLPEKNSEIDADEGDLDDDEGKQLNEGHDVSVKLTVEDGKDVKVDLNSSLLVSYAPKATKASKSPSMSDMGIDKSIFIKPKAFHLTLLMLKLWNKERVNAASEVLKNVSPKVMDALDNRPLFIRLKGLDCLKGSLAKARVLYAPVEEIGDEGRILRAAQVITDAFVEAGLVLDKDANSKLKLHATVMNTSHRRGKGRWRMNDSFDARGIFKQFGSEEWGEYLIREAHLSQRFVYDENGYYHCCASIPFPESMQVD